MSSDAPPLCPYSPQHVSDALQYVYSQFDLQRAENASLKIQVKRQQEEKDCLLADNLRMFEHSVEKSAACFKLEQENQDLRDELAALKAKQAPLGQDASTQTSPVESKDFSVQASPVESKDFSVQASPVESKDFSVQASPVESKDFTVQASPVESKDFAAQASPVEQTHAVAMKTRKLKVTRRMFAVQANTVTTKAKTVDEVRQEAAALCERDRMVLLSHDILICQAEITSILAEAKIVEALLKQEVAKTARTPAKQETVKVAKNKEKAARAAEAAKLEEQEKASKAEAERKAHQEAVRARQEQERRQKAERKAKMQTLRARAEEQARLEAARLEASAVAKSGRPAVVTSVLNPAQIGQVENFAQITKETFLTRASCIYEFSDKGEGLPCLLALYVLECFGSTSWQLKQAEDNFLLVVDREIGVNKVPVYYQSPLVSAEDIVFWVERDDFVKGSVFLFKHTPVPADERVAATIINAFELIRKDGVFEILKLRKADLKDSYGLAMQQITLVDKSVMTMTVLKMIIWFRQGRIQALATCADVKKSMVLMDKMLELAEDDYYF